MLKCYFDLMDLDKENPYNQCIWNNQRICINQKSYFNKQLSNCGLNLVSDLFNVNGDIIPFNFWHEKGIPNNEYLHWISLVNAVPGILEATFKAGF